MQILTKKDPDQATGVLKKSILSSSTPEVHDHNSYGEHGGHDGVAKGIACRNFLFI